MPEASTEFSSSREPDSSSTDATAGCSSASAAVTAGCSLTVCAVAPAACSSEYRCVITVPNPNSLCVAVGSVNLHVIHCYIALPADIVLSRYALQHGYTLRPTYTFGEEETYNTVKGFLKFRMMFNKLKLPGVVFWGSWLCPFMPRSDAELTTVVGEPLQLPLIESPSSDQVAEWHRKYIEALQGVFDRNVGKYARDREAKLELF